MKKITMLMVLLLFITGCGQSSGLIQQGVYSGKAIEGISEAAWTFKAEPGTALSQTLVTDRNTYFGSDKLLYAVNSKTGEKEWSHPIDGYPTLPALAGNILSYNDNSGIHAVNADSGEEIWKYDYNQQLPDEVKSKVTVASSTHVFIIEQTQGGRTSLKALEAKTGKEAWKFGDDLSVTMTPSLSQDKLYIPAAGKIHIINQKTGMEVKVIDTEMLVSNVAVSKDSIYAVGMGSKVIVAYDINKYGKQWEYMNEEIAMPNIPTLTLLKDKIIVSEMKNGIMVGIDSKSGKELWNVKVGDKKYLATIPTSISTPPSVLEDTLYIGAWGGENEKFKGAPAFSNLIAIDGKTGTELWKQRVDNFIMYPPSFINGKVVVTNMYETVVAYQGGKETKSVIKKQDEKKPVSIKTDELTIHGLKLGVSTDDVVKSLGMPQDKQTDTSLNSTIYKYKNLELLFVAGKLAAIKTNDKEYQTKQGIRPSSLLEELLKAYNGYEGYFGKKLAIIKGENALLIFNLGRFFDNDPYSVGNMSIINIKPTLDNPKSAEGYYLANLIQQEGAIASLIDSGFALIDSTSIESITDKVSFGEQAEKIKSKEVAEKSPEPKKAESNSSSSIKEFEGQWSTPGSDELAFKLAFKSDTKGTISFFLSEGKKSTSNIEIVYDKKQLIYNYEGANKITVLKLIDSKTMIFEGYDGKRTTLEKVND